MEDLIAHIAVVNHVGGRFSSIEEQTLLSEFDKLLEKIAGREDQKAAEGLLDQLGDFQTELARACFKWKVPLPPSLRLFVGEFDRFDDPQIRTTTFKKIKKHNFCLLK